MTLWLCAAHALRPESFHPGLIQAAPFLRTVDNTSYRFIIPIKDTEGLRSKNEATLLLYQKTNQPKMGLPPPTEPTPPYEETESTSRHNHTVHSLYAFVLDIQFSRSIY